MITRNMVRQGIEQNLTKLVNEDLGVTCTICIESFYFGEPKTHGITAEKYLASHTEEEIASKIFMQLQFMDENRHFYANTYDVCKGFLRKNLSEKMSETENSIKRRNAMSTEYYIYTEAKIDDKWILIDGKCKNLKTGEYEITPTYTCWSRSYFYQAYEKLHDISSGKPKEMSAELSKTLREPLDDNRDVIDIPVIAVDFKKLQNSTKGFDHHGFIHKDDLEAFNAGDLEEIFLHWEDPADENTLPPVANRSGFYMLTPEERNKLFQYMEWDDHDGWRHHFKKIISNVEMRVNDFCKVNYLEDLQEIRLLVFSY